MKFIKAVFLIPEENGPKIQKIALDTGFKTSSVIVSNLQQLELAFATEHNLLLSFGTSVIVPDWILQNKNLLSLNVHAASPNYPGRDPHHFAVYNNATQYGATLHFMTSKVDSGPIIDVKMFNVSLNQTPADLLHQANQAGWVT